MRFYRPIFLVFIITILIQFDKVIAQDDVTVSDQLWNSFIGDYVFKSGKILDTELAYNQLIIGDADWYEIAITPMLEMYPLT